MSVLSVVGPTGCRLAPSPDMRSGKHWERGAGCYRVEGHLRPRIVVGNGESLIN